MLFLFFFFFLFYLLLPKSANLYVCQCYLRKRDCGANLYFMFDYSRLMLKGCSCFFKFMGFNREMLVNLCDRLLERILSGRVIFEGRLYTFSQFGHVTVYSLKLWTV